VLLRIKDPPAEATTRACGKALAYQKRQRRSSSIAILLAVSCQSGNDQACPSASAIAMQRCSPRISLFSPAPCHSPHAQNANRDEQKMNLHHPDKCSRTFAKPSNIVAARYCHPHADATGFVKCSWLGDRRVDKIDATIKFKNELQQLAQSSFDQWGVLRFGPLIGDPVDNGALFGKTFSRQ